MVMAILLGLWVFHLNFKVIYFLFSGLFLPTNSIMPRLLLPYSTLCYQALASLYSQCFSGLPFSCIFLPPASLVGLDSAINRDFCRVHQLEWTLWDSEQSFTTLFPFQPSQCVALGSQGGFNFIQQIYYVSTPLPFPQNTEFS